MFFIVFYLKLSGATYSDSIMEMTKKDLKRPDLVTDLKKEKVVMLFVNSIFLLLPMSLKMDGLIT